MKCCRSDDGKLDLEEFSTLIKSLSPEMDNESVEQLFALLDRDEDGDIEFDDVLVFIFSTTVDMTPEVKRIRSFRFYDRYLHRSF